MSEEKISLKKDTDQPPRKNEPGVSRIIGEIFILLGLISLFVIIIIGYGAKNYIPDFLYQPAAQAETPPINVTFQLDKEEEEPKIEWGEIQEPRMKNHHVVLIMPGTTTREHILTEFGAPTGYKISGDKEVLIYDGSLPSFTTKYEPFREIAYKHHYRYLIIFPEIPATFDDDPILKIIYGHYYTLKENNNLYITLTNGVVTGVEGPESYSASSRSSAN
jgi:hypothetical protein